MPDTSSGQLAFVKETVAGTTPATPAFLVVDMTSEDLVKSTTQIRSAAISANRVVKGSRRAGQEVGGGFGFELYKGAEVDAILASLLGNAFTGTAPNLVAKAGGSVVDTYTFERRISATQFRRFTGCRIGTAEFSVAPEAHIGVRVGVLGASMVTAAAIVTGATYTAPTAGEKLTALDVAAITLSDGVTGSFDYESLTFTVNNQLAARRRIGPNSIRSVGAGQVLVTGTLRAYEDNNVLADAFNAETKFNMDVPARFGGSGYDFLFKDVAITAFNDPNTGNGDEYMATIEFEATLESAFGSSFAISKTS